MSARDPFALELTADLIVRAYQAGIFPMAESEEDDELFWVNPEKRGIIPLDSFHISKSLRKVLNHNPYRVTVDTDYDGIIEGCAHEGSDRDSTWINATIRRLYGELFARKICHTVEVWDGGELIGGLYGLAIGGAFFGESMFHRKTNASKIALVHLVERLLAGNFVLLDTQFITPHLASFGAVEVPREAYEQMLGTALKIEGDFYAMDAS